MSVASGTPSPSTSGAGKPLDEPPLETPADEETPPVADDDITVADDDADAPPDEEAPAERDEEDDVVLADNDAAADDVAPAADDDAPALEDDALALGDDALALDDDALALDDDALALDDDATAEEEDTVDVATEEPVAEDEGADDAAADDAPPEDDDDNATLPGRQAPSSQRSVRAQSAGELQRSTHVPSRSTWSCVQRCGHALSAPTSAPATPNVIQRPAFMGFMVVRHRRQGKVDAASPSRVRDGEAVSRSRTKLSGDALLHWIASQAPAGRDAAVEEYLGIRAERAVVPRLQGDRVGYFASGVGAIIGMLHGVPVGPGDVLVDVGSGRGKVTLLAELLIGVRTRGVEVDAEHLAVARRAAHELGCSRAEWEHADAADGGFEDGTVFFLYYPFTGGTLTRVLERIRTIALHRAVVVCTLGFELPESPWLRPRASEDLWLTIHDSEHAGVPARAPRESALAPEAAERVISGAP